MQFRSYTYDATEIDIQYALDSRGKEIREIQLDEGFSGENVVGWMEQCGECMGFWVGREEFFMTQNTNFSMNVK